MFNPPSLKFYYAPGACSLVPHILLHAANLQYEPVPCVINTTTASFPTGFKDLNPKQRVPTLLIDQEIITEIPAVCTAISNITPSKHLMGKPGLENIRVLEWINYLSGTLHGGAFGHLFRPGRFTIDEEGEKGVEKRAREAIWEDLSFVEGKLREGEWAVGDQMTGVDAFLLVFWRWGVMYGFEMGDLVKYKGLMERVVGEECVKKAFVVEGIEGMVD